jgi:hypothetical protein
LIHRLRVASRVAADPKEGRGTAADTAAKTEVRAMTTVVQAKILGQPQSLERSQTWHAVAPASIGNALEWFDFVIYGFFAVTIAKLFFPAADDPQGPGNHAWRRGHDRA